MPYDYQQYDCKDELRTDLAFDFLDERNKEQPFFLFLCIGKERCRRE